MDSQEEHIKVSIRVRPFLSYNNYHPQIIRIDDEKTIHIDDSEHTITSHYDKIFSQNSSQKDVFDFVCPSVLQTLEGFNATIFAYGQTGSGKTHTIFGVGWENNELFTENSNQGIIPRAISKLFSIENEYISFNLNFLQIYNEHLYDLLSDPARAKSLRIREYKSEIFIDGLEETSISSANECMLLLSEGIKNRAVRQTRLNNQSSRSHSIFQLYVINKKGGFRRSKLSFCDLAGCERYDKEYEMNNGHINELKNINKSLSTLGMVIHALASGNKEHIPYRDSKLTRLLQDSLGGNTKTILIATISPQIEHVDTTINTLIFADRAKEIMVRVKRNEPAAMNSTEIIINLQQEIEKLKSLLSVVRVENGASELNKKVLELEQENEYLRRITENQEVEYTDVSEDSEEENHILGLSPSIGKNLLKLPDYFSSKSQKISPEPSDHENYSFLPAKTGKNTKRYVFSEDLDFCNKRETDSPFPHTKNFSTYIGTFPSESSPIRHEKFYVKNVDNSPAGRGTLAKSTKNLRSLDDLIEEKYVDEEKERKLAEAKLRKVHHRLTRLDELEAERKMKFKMDFERITYEKRKEKDKIRLELAEKERRRQIRREKRIREMQKIKKFEEARRREEMARLEAIMKIEENNKRNEEKKKEKILEQKRKLAEFNARKQIKQERGFISGAWG
ncbi:unnamed protein product [Blepharisma stoltei]|uniref:Kinesin motor domain-containing protein n=1 Tax=Blepharisma stoltei TaxID=1481888 RepID=A0AAU9ILV0_9CILI|nr:unnamed protein product [Blepharisma stoltei]